MNGPDFLIFHLGNHEKMGVNESHGLLVYSHGLGECKIIAVASYVESLDFTARRLVWKN